MSSGSAGSIVTTPRALAINSYHAHTSGNEVRRRRSALGSVRRGLRVDAACFAPDIITINISSGAAECLVENVFDATNPARDASHDARDARHECEELTELQRRRVTSCTRATTSLRSRLADRSIARFG
jgi:hypothetical protein